MSTHPDVLNDREWWACQTAMTTCLHWFDPDYTAFWATCERCRDGIAFLALSRPTVPVDVRSDDDPLGYRPYTAFEALTGVLRADGAL